MKHTGYGKLQYEYTDAKTPYDATAKLTTTEKLLNVYLLLIAAGMLVWYLYSAITHSMRSGFINAFLSGGHLIYLLMLVAIELIIILSAFKLWGKFMRFSLKHNLVDREKPEVLNIESELKRADANKHREHALYVYTSYLVIINNGIETVLNRSVLRSVSAKKIRNSELLSLEFFLKEDDRKYYYSIVPYSDIIKLRKIFSGLLSEQSEKSEIKNVERGKDTVGVVCFGGLFVLIGIALIISRFTFMRELENVPLFIGIFFSLCGALTICSQFYHYAVFKYGLVPLFAGFAFFILPFGIIYLIGQELGVTFNSFFATFNYNAAAVFLLSFSPVFIAYGIAGIIKCLIYRKR